MKQMKAKDFRDQSVEELDASVEKARHDLYVLKCEQKRTKQIEKPHSLRTKRKEIARMLTVLAEKSNATVESTK